MNILLISKKIGCSRCFSFGSWGLSAIATGLFVVLPAFSLYAGYHLGKGDSSHPEQIVASAVEQEMAQQRSEIIEAKRQAEDNLNALTLRLGKLQAHVTRLDALGQRLTEVANLDNGEFNFVEPPAQGGPESSGELASISVPDFLTQLEQLGRMIEDRDQQLDMLEKVVMNHNLQASVSPTGRPIKKGWVSSNFGMRTDPFTGKQEFHKGVDLAGKKGSDIIAVASGVVTWAGDRYGYGNMIEINHGKGLSTRYGHNSELLVKVGDTVNKGQRIAQMGSTGRSTGPHVHFEVWREGKAVDPSKYLYAKK
jgi:murein DD-endopeptidase MepM/ murein hydrolase activator NlpD